MSHCNRREFLTTTAAAPLARAQEVGMGERRGSARRFEAPYTLNVETPHVKWARPLAGGPIRLLAVPTVSEGRTLIELAQRLSLELATVTIDPAWDLNKWTMCFGPDYGARAERGDLGLIYNYLESELTSGKIFDAVLLPLVHGWERLTAPSREALARRVNEGCGLVVTRPFAGGLSPLIPIAAPPAEADELEEPRRAGRTEKSGWRRRSDHYITRAVPIESFPAGYLENHFARAAPGAHVLAESETGHPLLTVKSHGKGRVAAFAYRNAGLSWYMSMQARNDPVDVYWEYFYALLCRTLIWAAGREPAKPPDWDSIEVDWRLRDLHSEVKRSGRGRRPRAPDLPPGRYFLELQSGSDWQVTAIDVPQPETIRDLQASPEIIGEGDTVDVTWKSSRPARIELIDALGRLLARETGERKVRLKAGRPLVHSGWVRATAGTATEQVPVRFAASSRDWTDYEIMLPWYGPRSYQPWIPAVDGQFRHIGITTLATPVRNFKMMVSAHLPGFGIYWYRRQRYLKRKAAYAGTGDKKYLTRDVTLQSPQFEAGARKLIEARVRPAAALKPLAYYLADESSLTCYTDPFDVDWAPEALAGFREWLRNEYPSLADLNRTWGTAFQSWDAIVPMTTEEARKHGNFAPWADHRAYMESEFVAAFARARGWLKEVDPDARGSISGTQIPTAHNGCNWHSIDQQLDYIQPYSGGNQDAMHHLFDPALLLTGFTGYGSVGLDAQSQQWRRLFYGHSGASIFWHYTLMNPDLTLSEQGTALAEAFNRIQSGIGKLFMNSPVREDGVAIHFSMASIRGAWITDGAISKEMSNAVKSSKNFAELMKRRDAWVRELERQRLQFRFLATPEIEAGALDKYRVLVLPYSIALSDREIAQIERFLGRGGRVYADEQTGRMDERCRWRKQPLWDRERKGLFRRGPGEVGLKPAVDVEGEFLTTVRDFGQSRLIGLLPKKNMTVALPRLHGVVYDLLRGEIADQRIEASPARPVVFVVRPNRIAHLEIDPSLTLRLTDEAGAPVDRSVVRIEVFGPGGQRLHYYCSNVLIASGNAKLRIPFALGEVGQRLKIRACDVISGLTAEREFTLQSV